jgi:hypothetical protein
LHVDVGDSNLLCVYCVIRTFSTREAAEQLDVHLVTLQRHIAAQTIPVPPLQKVGGVTVRLWTDHQIEKARKVLAGIKPVRKPKRSS